MKTRLAPEVVTRFAVYVPLSGVETGISKASAIVGRPHSTGRGVVIGYQGNLYSTSNMHQFEENLFNVVGREIGHTPTEARRYYPDEQVEAQFALVGHYEYRTKVFTPKDAAAQVALTRWLR